MEDEIKNTLDGLLSDLPDVEEDMEKYFFDESAGQDEEESEVAVEPQPEPEPELELPEPEPEAEVEPQPEPVPPPPPVKRRTKVKKLPKPIKTRIGKLSEEDHELIKEWNNGNTRVKHILEKKHGLVRLYVNGELRRGFANQLKRNPEKVITGLDEDQNIIHVTGCPAIKI